MNLDVTIPEVTLGCSLMDEMELMLSPLPKTWIIDIDGTIVRHNGYKNNGKDDILEKSREFISRIPTQDFIILVTSRGEELKEMTESFLESEGIRFNHIIYNLPFGERVLINDKKPSGLKTAYAINISRDEGIGCIVCINNML